VSLGGSVSSRDEKDRAEAIARSVPGVASVYDDLAVK
jgi:osmotically-inducible protein OsmY